MHKPLRIGVTGGIGSGKSIVCKIFATLGVPIYDADTMARKLMTSDAVLVDQIKSTFGALSYLADGSLNREYLSAEVFNNTAKLDKLNALVHPRMAVDSERWMDDNKRSFYVIKEAALLYEAGSYKSLDKIIVVSAPKHVRVQRVMRRDPSRSTDDVLKIISSQMPEIEKKKRADFVVSNDESEL